MKAGRGGLADQTGLAAKEGSEGLKWERKADYSHYEGILGLAQGSARWAASRKGT